MQISANRLPKHLRPRREKFFGAALSHPLPHHEKQRFWAELQEFNRTRREGRQHIGPYTRTMMTAWKKLIFGFHNADGTGRCFPSHEAWAKVAGCCKDTIWRLTVIAERYGHLDWQHRLKRVACVEPDELLGGLRRVTRVHRTSNSYRIPAPLNRQSCKSENQGGLLNLSKKKEGARLAGAPVYVGEPASAPPQAAELPLALRREHGRDDRFRLAPHERAAIVARMDRGEATKEDRARWSCDLDARLDAMLFHNEGGETMPTSKHRRKGKTRPRGVVNLHMPPDTMTAEDRALEAARSERENAFLHHTGRTNRMSDADWEDMFESQEWRDWKRQHPLPNDDE